MGLEGLLSDLQHQPEALLDRRGDAGGHVWGGVPVVGAHDAAPLLAGAAGRLKAHHATRGKGGCHGPDCSSEAWPTQPIWQFARHFLEMCVAMCVGGGILNGLVFVAGPALLGYPDLRQQSPELALLVAFDFTLPMTQWMRFRGMAWRPTLEMSGATIGLAIVMIGLDWLDVVQTSTLRGLVFGFCGPACVVMLVVMLFRLELYTGRTGHHLGQVRHTVHAA